MTKNIKRIKDIAERLEIRLKPDESEAEFRARVSLGVLKQYGDAVEAAEIALGKNWEEFDDLDRNLALLLQFNYHKEKSARYEIVNDTYFGMSWEEYESILIGNKFEKVFSYGFKDTNDPNETPSDIDNDGIPDDDSPDKKYSGDLDDDNDGIEDDIELSLDSDPKSSFDVDNVKINGEESFMVDTLGDGKFDKFYNPETDTMTDLEYSNGNYLINMDEDPDWEFVYNPAQGTITEYSDELLEKISKKSDSDTSSEYDVKCHNPRNSPRRNTTCTRYRTGWITNRF